MTQFSLLNLARHALSRNRKWNPTWRDTSPQRACDVIIIGGGGHGRATVSREGLKRIDESWLVSAAECHAAAVSHGSPGSPVNAV